MPTRAATADPRLDQARRLLDDHDLGLEALGAAVGLSATHLQRRFRDQFGLTPAEYLAQRRLAALKRGLRGGRSVTHALYDAGYGSPSRVYQDGAARLGMPPLAYGRGGAGLDIRWSLVDTALGQALVAATERGICAVALGDDPQALERELRDEFPNATLHWVEQGREGFLAPRLRAVADALASRSGTVPVELVGTAFQLRVWQALMRIPPGETRSYAELAASLDAPRAARAVARACASNRVAVLVPCHRVIRGDGTPGGYRWGLPRKQALLASESLLSKAQPKSRA
ncbi:MAG: methylated-DNA--[protein]-cysteine S-methyltransferase [Arenimonas sp.]|uniref:methylated-DNA--[protein]-cysteine S-methyltransferase n=1 Tax=Arenimonas sp. TaxID=1872635 RepID=UPI0025B9A1EF|nr:methylated-DNA--[protein]-cysteine S-methyltransferase [Arenimonas sp.]MBW8367596.1 methylated-DNA--[protein]-cysteine S-methyltransferase [Arenimonas sp.]